MHGLLYLRPLHLLLIVKVMEDSRYDIAVIGGGCVGVASAYKIKMRHPGLRVVILEKEGQLAAHQTGRNSGVIHSGLYYKPGSYKARNCVDGRRELVAFAREHRIPHDICGKVIVATDPSEIPHMEKAFANGRANGVEGIEKIGPDRIREIEPACAGIAGIWVPCTGIIDFVALTRKLAELTASMDEHAVVLLHREARGFRHVEGGIDILTNRETIRARHIVNCTGLFSDRIAVREGVQPGLQIVGFRGDYYELAESALDRVRNLIYPVPNPAFPFLGVHFTRMIHGGVECGPNAVFTFKREGYGKTDFNLRDTLQALGYIGTWRLMMRHWRFGLDEYKRAFSKRLFLQRLRKLIPSLEMDDIVTGRAGVRAMALGPDGNMIDDFKIISHDRALHVLNAPSPAATACLAIGEAVNKMAEEHFKLDNDIPTSVR